MSRKHQPQPTAFGLEFIAFNAQNFARLSNTPRQYPPRREEDVIKQIALIKREDFYKKGPTLFKLRGLIMRVAMDSRGSWYLSSKLRLASETELSMVYEEVMVNPGLLSIHPYAHYVIQRMFQRLDPFRCSALLDKLKVRKVISNPHGNYVIQSAIEALPPQLKLKLVYCLKGSIVDIARSIYGSCALCKIIDPASRTDLSSLSFFCTEILGRVIHLSLDHNSSKIIQKIIRHFPEETVRPILEILHVGIQALLSSGTGSRVIEEMMRRGQYDRNRVIEVIRHHIPNLAISGPGSYVALTALELASPGVRRYLISLLSQRKVLNALNQNKYGKRVIGLMFGMASCEQQEEIKARLYLPYSRRF